MKWIVRINSENSLSVERTKTRTLSSRFAQIRARYQKLIIVNKFIVYWSKHEHFIIVTFVSLVLRQKRIRWIKLYAVHAHVTMWFHTQCTDCRTLCAYNIARAFVLAANFWIWQTDDRIGYRYIRWKDSRIRFQSNFHHLSIEKFHTARTFFFSLPYAKRLL